MPTLGHSHDKAAALPGSPFIPRVIFNRLRGPGGLYNAGNVVMIATGIALQFHAARIAGGGATDAIWAYFFGSPAASILTAAIALFLIGGEIYHRAWADPAHLDFQLIGRGDLICGFAALTFTVALVLVGDTALALAGGTMLTLGRFGLVVLPDRFARKMRWLVAVSRVPSLAAVGITLVVLTRSDAPAIDLVAPAVLFCCLLVWLKADMMFPGLWSNQSDLVTFQFGRSGRNTMDDRMKQNCGDLNTTASLQQNRHLTRPGP